jgi:hypothetical protein
MSEYDSLLDSSNIQKDKKGDAHKTSWISSASIIVANMLGAGVLGLPYATKGMGMTVAAILMFIVTSMRYDEPISGIF